jgi:hypothetical protein
MQKQTAVEWLVKQIVDRQNGNGDSRGFDEIIEQAIQMEAEQLIDAWENGIDNCGEFDTPTIATGKQYYNETYGVVPTK